MSEEVAVPSEAVRVELFYRERDQAVVVMVNGVAQSNISLKLFLEGIGVDLAEVRNVLGDASHPIPIGVGESPEILAFRRSILDRIDFAGKDVIDVGGYDGWASQEALHRGAKSATIVDNGQFINYHWRPPATPDNVRFIGSDINEWQQPADVIILGGMIYHVNDPWKTLWHCHHLAKELVVWSSYYDSPEPVWRVCDIADETTMPTEGFYSTMWMPSPTGLLRLCHRTGWRDIELIGPELMRIGLVARR